MRFLIDENIDVRIVAWLNDKGHDAIRVPSGHKNGQVIALCVSETRVLLTLDKDFGDQLHYPPASHCGIVLFRVHPPLLARLKVCLEQLITKTQDINKKLILLQEDGFHVIS